MNNCAFHARNAAVVNCSGCGRALCPQCDHRIKGFAFCQECIVAGVELLRTQRSSAANAYAVRRSSPFLAVILSFVCPGLGAAYNGHNSKALVHFGLFVGLFQMAILTDGMPLFVLGFLGMWLFAAVDAGRSARAMKYGQNPVADDLLTRRLSGNPLGWAIALIGLGVIFFVHTVLGVTLPMRQMLPILLVALGVYSLINYVQRRRTQDALPAAYPSALPPSLMDEEATYASVNVARFRSANKY